MNDIKRDKIPFIVALAVGGVMEHPDIVYKNKQIIWAYNADEARKLYNEINRCNYYYGEVLGVDKSYYN